MPTFLATRKARAEDMLAIVLDAGLEQLGRGQRGRDFRLYAVEYQQNFTFALAERKFGSKGAGAAGTWSGI